MIPEFELTEQQQKLHDMVVFFAKLIGAGLVFQTILIAYPNTMTIQAGFAQIVAGILSVTGMNFQATGISIASGDVAYIITQDCLGWKSMAVFTGLVFASTSRYRYHARYIAIGLGVIAVANLVRVVSTVYLAEIGVISFGVIHGILWRWGLTVLVLFMWLVWFRKAELENEVFRIGDVLEEDISRLKNRLE